MYDQAKNRVVKASGKTKEKSYLINGKKTKTEFFHVKFMGSYLYIL